jgi:hypothetical protein
MLHIEYNKFLFLNIEHSPPDILTKIVQYLIPI